MNIEQLSKEILDAVNKTFTYANKTVVVLGKYTTENYYHIDINVNGVNCIFIDSLNQLHEKYYISTILTMGENNIIIEFLIKKSEVD